VAELKVELSVSVSPEALDEMMANPEAAIGGLEKGFAEHIGVPREQVSVTETDPDLSGGAGFDRRLQETTELKVSYKVETKEGDNVEAMTETLQNAKEDSGQLEALTASIQTSLAEEGVVIEVTVMAVGDVEVTVLVPDTTASPTPSPHIYLEEEESSNAVVFIIIGVIVFIGIVVAGYSMSKGGAPPANEQQPLKEQVTTQRTESAGGDPGAEPAEQDIEEIAIQIVEQESGALEVADEDVAGLTSSLEVVAERTMPATAPAIEGPKGWFASFFPAACDMSKNPCVADGELRPVTPGEQTIP
jgi:hypothetical protein